MLTATLSRNLDLEMSEGHVGELKQCLGIAQHESLPEEVENSYWEMKRIYDRIGARIAKSDLAQIAFLQGYGKPTAKELAPPTVVELWRRKQIKAEDMIEVNFRNEWQIAALKGVTGNGEVEAQIVDDPEERRFKSVDVRVAD